MALRDCSGSVLPAGQIVGCSDPVHHFADCCTAVPIFDEVLLDERLASDKGEYYYWLWLNADETPLVVCALEQYADQDADWLGRRADYLAVGWYDGDCYLVVIELRRTLVKEQNAQNKLDQVEHSIKQVISQLLPQLTTSTLFSEACHEPEEYKIVGVVIPVEHSKKRAQQTRLITVGAYKAAIVSIPHSRIKECRIGWSELLTAIGL